MTPALFSLAARLAAGALLALLLASRPALAEAIRPGSPASCWTHGPTLAFGVYRPLAGVATLSDTSLQLSCKGGGGHIAYKLSLGPGPVSPSVLDRRMPRVLGGSRMQFNVYVDAPHMFVWGDGLQGSATITGTTTPGSRQKTHVIYGKIPAGQTHLQPGDYAVSIPITVMFEP